MINRSMTVCCQSSLGNKLYIDDSQSNVISGVGKKYNTQKVIAGVRKYYNIQNDNGSTR